jgi:hypothetical protein
MEADATKARAAARQHMSFYVTRLPNYRNNLKALGWQDEDFDNGCSDRLVDAIVAWGTEDKIRDGIQAHFCGRSHACLHFNRFVQTTDRSPTFVRSRRSQLCSLESQNKSSRNVLTIRGTNQVYSIYPTCLGCLGKYKRRRIFLEA